MFDSVPEFRPFGGTGRRDRAFDIFLHCCLIPLVLLLLPALTVVAWLNHLYVASRKLFLRTLIDVAEASGTETGVRNNLNTPQQQLMRYPVRAETRSLIRETFSFDLACALLANACAYKALQRIRYRIMAGTSR